MSHAREQRAHKGKRQTNEDSGWMNTMLQIWKASDEGPMEDQGVPKPKKGRWKKMEILNLLKLSSLYPYLSNKN